VTARRSHSRLLRDLHLDFAHNLVKTIRPFPEMCRWPIARAVGPEPALAVEAELRPPEVPTSQMRQVLYFINWLLAATCGLALFTLVAYPELVAERLDRRAERAVMHRALAQQGELREVLDRDEQMPTLIRALSHESEIAQKLRDTALARYAGERHEKIVAELRRDLLIFSATNLVLFVLAALAVRRKEAGQIAMVLSLILSASAFVGVWCYYHQNWLETLLLSSYYGYGYIALVAAIGGSLSDIAFNDARVLYVIFDGLMSVVGYWLAP
jgi:hypothetical protein